jgi:hypothetical protein
MTAREKMMTANKEIPMLLLILRFEFLMFFCLKINLVFFGLSSSVRVSKVSEPCPTFVQAVSVIFFVFF